MSTVEAMINRRSGLIQYGFSVALVLLVAGTVLAADWSSCQDDLDRLRRRASDASDAASNVRDAAERAERKRREWENCRTFPEVYDLWRDRCQSPQREYEGARRSYESVKTDLESKLEDVDSVLRSVESSCDYSFGARGAGTPYSGDPFCRLLQRYKGRVPTAALLETCKKSRSEEECKKCLE